VPQALKIVEEESPGLVLLDIFLQGNLTGIDLAKILKEKNIAFIYLSANSNKNILGVNTSTLNARIKKLGIDKEKKF